MRRSPSAVAYEFLETSHFVFNYSMICSSLFAISEAKFIMSPSAFSQMPLGNVLIIGGCGLLGHHIVKFLLENGTASKDIIVFDINTKANRYPNVTYIEGDLASKTETLSAFDHAKPNVIINVASPDALTPKTEVFERCNVLGVQNVINCAQERGVRVLVHSSSSEVVQDSYYDMVWATEDWAMPENPVDGT
jgi:sterol-4alpha-carboxylate 3-dehydrogenase (decarboxylating)